MSIKKGTIKTQSGDILYPHTTADIVSYTPGSNPAGSVGNKLDHLPDLAETTYSALKTLITNSQLIPGKFYRITDFVTTTVQARTQSAGHQFDIIVQAISNSELSEDASACLHSGDTYFANSNLKAWILKYNFNNDTTRYAWADYTNGKGVIYYMKDEFHNECGYDFKNIKFARYKVTACANCTSLVGRYIGVVGLDGNAILTSYMTIDTSDYKWFYTFDLCQTDYSMNRVGQVVVTPTGSITLNQIQCTKCLIAPHEDDSSKFYLNNVATLIEGNKDCMFVIKGFSKDSTLLGGSSAFEALNILSSIIGGGGTAFDGYVGQTSSAIEIDECLIYSNSSNGRAFSSSTVVNVGQNCLISDGGYVFCQCVVGMMGACTIKCSNINFYRSNIEMIVSCSGSGSGYYIYYSTINYLAAITMSNLNLGAQPFIYYCDLVYINTCTFEQVGYCKIPCLIQSSFTILYGCSFSFTRNVTCGQGMKGCNFGYNVSYLTISSTTTTQIITNTNFHDITGTSSATKNVVIPEDYTNLHTVEIYAAGQYTVHEIE